MMWQALKEQALQKLLGHSSTPLIQFNLWPMTRWPTVGSVGNKATINDPNIEHTCHTHWETEAINLRPLKNVNL